MRYSKIFLPVFFSLFFLLLILFATLDFNTVRFINHFYKLLNDKNDLFLLITYITVSGLLTGLLTFYLRKHINILFFTIVYLSSSISVISAHTYFELSKGKNPRFDILFSYIFFLLICFITVEFLSRFLNTKLAKNVFFGKRLILFSKNPSLFNNSNAKSDFIMINFDVPRFYNVQEKAKIEDINNFFTKVNKIINKTLEDYNAVLINRTQVSAIYAIEKAKFNSPVYSEDVDYAYYGVLSAISIKNAFSNLKVNNFFLDELKPRFFIASNNARVIQKTKDKKLDFYLLSDSFKTIEKLKLNNLDDDLITMDANTHNMVSNYFSTKEVLNNSYAVIGISSY